MNATASPSLTNAYSLPMLATPVVPGLHAIPVGGVNVFLIDCPDGCVLIDAGFPGRSADILKGIAAAGRKPSDVRHIVVTHGHPDHIGSLAAIKAATGAAVHVHRADRAIVESGQGFRRLKALPGRFNRVMFKLISRRMDGQMRVDPTVVDHELADGQVLPIAGGLRVIHVPGHCTGQVALLWPQHGGVLFVADAAVNVLGLRTTMACEDLAAYQRSLATRCREEFQIACFGHGTAITRDASKRFRRRWPEYCAHSGV